MRTDAKLLPENVVAIVDTREQTPLCLDPLQVEVGTLATGDYGLRDLPMECAIERKSESDLLSVVGRDRERFDREVDRLLAYRTRVLLVETSWQRLERGEWRSKLTPNQVIGSLLGWIARDLPVLMAGDHERAGRYAARILFCVARRRHRELTSLTDSKNGN